VWGRPVDISGAHPAPEGQLGSAGQLADLQQQRIGAAVAMGCRQGLTPFSIRAMIEAVIFSSAEGLRNVRSIAGRAQTMKDPARLLYGHRQDPR
jgi:hypothetical protein